MDSHAFNAYGFWKNEMPLISQASANEVCYQINTSSGKVFIKQSDIVMYQGREYTGLQLAQLIGV